MLCVCYVWACSNNLEYKSSFQFRGAFRSADLGPAHRFLMENVVAMLWIY